MARLGVLPLLFAVLAVLACGSSGPAPSSAASVAGIWSGNATIVSVEGGDCIGDDIRTRVGTSARILLTIEQSGSQVTATWSSPNSPGTFNYSGMLTSDTLTLALSFCSICNLSDNRCNNGTLVDTHLMAGKLDATTDGRTMNGSDFKGYTVVPASGSTLLGVMSARSTVSLTKVR